MNIKDLALRAAVLKVLADAVESQIGVVKDQLKAGFKTTGTSQSVPQLPDGMKVATVSLAGDGGTSVSVVDENAFTAWVAATYPGEMVMVVRDTFKKKLLDGAKAAGQPVDPATGEVIPGVRVGPSSPYVSLRMKPGGKEAIIQAWQAGLLEDIPLVEPPAIEAGEAA